MEFEKTQQKQIQIQNLSKKVQLQQNFEFEKYLTDEHNLQATLKEFGVAIIENVLNKQEIENMNKGAWSTLEQLLPGFSEKDDQSWRLFYDLIPMHSMLIQHHKIGHAQYVWDLRQNEKIVNIFSKLWGVDKQDLLVSFDGVSFHLPPEITKRGWEQGNSWLHLDQSPMRNEFECVQSWVTGYDVNEYDSTLTILEKSHLFHKKFQKTFSIESPSDWYKLKDEEIQFYQEQGCQQKYIKCPAGSMVFWDSRTVHSGYQASKMRKQQNFRNIVYISMTPRNKANPTQIIKKQKAFNEIRMTSHWPHKITLFPVNPRTYGKPLPKIGIPIKKPQLNSLGRKLAGF